MTISTRLRRIAIAATAAILVAVPLTACGSGGGAKPAADAALLRIGADSDYASYGYDPLRYGDGQVMFFSGLYDQLFRVQADGKTGPGLVTTWSYNADKTQMMWTLRDGVSFTDGSKLDADLVKANLDSRANKALSNYSSIAAGGAQEVTAVEVTGPMTLTLTFAKPQPAFENSLTHTIGFIVGKDAVADRTVMEKGPDGSGPYTLNGSASVKGSKYVFAKNSKEWRAKEYPYTAINWTVTDTSQARANALVSGQTDVAILLDSSVVSFTEQKKKVARQGGIVQSLNFWDKQGKRWEPSASEQVRQAFQWAIDRKGLVNTLHKGEKPAFNALPSSSAGFDKSLADTYAFDPAKAKSELAAAGYPNGVELTITTSADVQSDLQFIQKDLAQAGITMTIKVASSTDELFRSAAQEPLGGPMAISWANPVQTMNGTVVGGFLNLQKATDAQLTEATAAVAAATDDKQKAAALTTLNKRLMSSGWIIPLYEQFSNFGYDPAKVKPITFPGAEQWPLLSSFVPAP